MGARALSPFETTNALAIGHLKRLGYYVSFSRLASLIFLVIILSILTPLVQGYPAWLPLLPAFWIGLSVLIFALNYFWGNRRAFFVFQHVSDIIFVSILIYYTGGVDSEFIFLYFAVILSVAFTLADWTSMIFASSATLLISTKTLFTLLNPGGEPNLNKMFALLLAQSVAMHVVAWLSSLLAINLSRQRVLNDQVLENISDALFVVSPLHRLSYFNPMAQELLRLDSRSNGRLVDSVLQEKGLTNLLDFINLATRDNVEMEIEVAPGKIKPVHVRVSQMGASAGQDVWKVVLIEDLTDSRKLQEVESSSRRLEEYSEIAAGVAHEIRNPLSSIKGAAGEIQRDISDPELSRMASIVCKESDRLNRILSDFLQFSRIRSPVYQDTKVDEMLFDARDTFMSQTGHSISYVVDAPPELRIPVDPEQIKQVLLNLSLNSLQAAGENVKIKVSARKQNLRDFLLESRTRARGVETFHRDGVVILHEDDGPGIQQDAREKLFWPFFTTKEKGTGLGLAVAKRIIDSHNGKMVADLSTDHGAAFRLWIPATQYTGV
ncbi:MAG: ATP-binding protein [Candidatus Brocadiia bacterium]